MGYQESWYYVTPQSQFDNMILCCDERKRQGIYENLCTAPLSVVTLKQSIGNIPAGAKLLWVCGERYFQNFPYDIVGVGFESTLRQIRIIAIEEIQMVAEEAHEIDCDEESENSYINLDSFSQYTSMLRDGMA